MCYYSPRCGIIICSLLFFFCLQRLNALNMLITGKELGFGLRGEYNRTFASCGDFSLLGAIELNDKYTFKGGFAIGNLDDDTEIKAFTSGHIALFSVIPLYVNLAYNYYGLPEQRYNFHANAALPSVSLNGRWAGITIGVNFRFSSFLDEPSIFEPALAFLGYVNFFNNERLRVALSCANFSDFYMGNMGAYFFKLNADIHITNQWSLLSAIELLQSGGDGLTTAFYGIAYSGGLKFVW